MFKKQNVSFILKNELQLLANHCGIIEMKHFRNLSCFIPYVKQKHICVLTWENPLDAIVAEFWQPEKMKIGFWPK